MNIENQTDTPLKSKEEKPKKNSAEVGDYIPFKGSYAYQVVEVGDNFVRIKNGDNEATLGTADYEKLKKFDEMRNAYSTDMASSDYSPKNSHLIETALFDFINKIEENDVEYEVIKFADGDAGLVVKITSHAHIDDYQENAIHHSHSTFIVNKKHLGNIPSKLLDIIKNAETIEDDTSGGHTFSVNFS